MEAELRAAFRLTLRYLGPRAVEAFEREGGGRSTDAFVEWVRGARASDAVADRAARDLAAYEAAVARVERAGASGGAAAETRTGTREAREAPTAPAAVPDDAVVRLASDAVLLAVTTNVPDVVPRLEAGAEAVPEPWVGTVLVRRDPSDGRAVAAALDAVEEDVLLSCERPALAAYCVRTSRDAARAREVLAALVADGVVVVEAQS